MGFCVSFCVHSLAPVFVGVCMWKLQLWFLRVINSVCVSYQSGNVVGLINCYTDNRASLSVDGCVHMTWLISYCPEHLLKKKKKKSCMFWSPPLWIEKVELPVKNSWFWLPTNLQRSLKSPAFDLIKAARNILKHCLLTWQKTDGNIFRCQPHWL